MIFIEKRDNPKGKNQLVDSKKDNGTVKKNLLRSNQKYTSNKSNKEIEM
jgi:hypothetical protein